MSCPKSTKTARSGLKVFYKSAFCFLSQWLEEKQLIRLVCSKLGPENSPDDHDNAAQILTRIIDSLRKDDDASVLLATTESEETIRYLLELGFSPGPCSESGVISCVEIVLQLLDVNNK